MTSSSKPREARTLQEQLQRVRDAEQKEEYRRRNGSHDMDDIEVAFKADDSWSGQHARLTREAGKQPK